MIRRWVNIIPLNDSDIVDELEQTYKVNLGESFRSFIQLHNGGKVNPCPYVWVDEAEKGFLFYRVVSFNRADVDNVFSIIDTVSKGRKLSYIPFGMNVTMSSIFMTNGKSVCIYDTKEDKLLHLSSSFDKLMSYIFGSKH